MSLMCHLKVKALRQKQIDTASKTIHPKYGLDSFLLTLYKQNNWDHVFLLALIWLSAQIRKFHINLWYVYT